MVTCAVEGCDQPPRAARSEHGLCQKHYRRKQRHGDPLHFVGKGVYARPAAQERFWVKVRRGGPDECWPWTAAVNDDGYGTFKAGGKVVKVHRWVYEHECGPIPDGLEVHHTCETRACCNPRHLELRKHPEHVAMHRAKRPPQIHCKNDHPFDAENTYINPSSGQRVCKACRRAYQEARARERGVKPRQPAKPRPKRVYVCRNCGSRNIVPVPLQ